MLIVTIPWWAWLCWLPIRATYRLTLWTLCIAGHLAWRAGVVALRAARRSPQPTRR